MRGFFTAVLGLIALQALTSSEEAAGRAGGLISGLALVAEHVLSPAVPAIPDLRKPRTVVPGEGPGKTFPAVVDGTGSGDGAIPRLRLVTPA